MPAFVKSSVGSSWGKTGADGTSRCPRCTKKSRKSRRMRAADLVGLSSWLREALMEGEDDSRSPSRALAGERYTAAGLAGAAAGFGTGLRLAADGAGELAGVDDADGAVGALVELLAAEGLAGALASAFAITARESSSVTSGL